MVEGPPGSADRDLARVRASGYEIVAGFRAGPLPGRRVVRSGDVVDDGGAADALMAALAGSGLVISTTAPRGTVDRLVDDLRRLGPVAYRVASGRDSEEPELANEARAILGLLAEGHSLGEAAEVLGLARRTADRRLAEARRVLGVERTTEAIARARRRGWLGPDQPARRG